MGQLGVLGCLAVLGPNLSQVQSRTHDGVHFLSPGSRGGEPEPGGVDGDTGHRGGGHEVAHEVSPPGVVVVLVHKVLPGHQLEEEHARADQRRDHRPAGHEEVARVVANHVVQSQTETPRSEAPGHSNTLEKHEEQQTHSTCGVLIKQLEHVDSSLGDARQSNNVRNCTHCENKQLLVASQIFGELVDHRCDETLHGAELRVQAEKHQHEEEAGGPDRGEGHLEHGTGVGEESKTGS